MRVTNLTVNRSTLTSGQPFTITATVVNPGAGSAPYEATLHLFNETIQRKEVTVPADGTREVTFSVTIEAPGEYTARVGNASERIVVTEGQGSSTARDTGGLVSDIGPIIAGVGPIVAVTALLALGWLARRRNELR